MKKKILFVYFHDLKAGSGGARRAFQNLCGCMRFGAADTWQTGGRTPADTEGMDIPKGRELLFISAYEAVRIAEIINKYRYDIVFFDTSLYGEAVGIVRERCPKVRIVVHCHNFEKKYFEDMRKNGEAGPDSETVARCEAASLRASDRIVLISREDREAVCREYGIPGEACAVIPPALADGYHPYSRAEKADPYVLFLGSAFFANLEAARFLIRKVAPYADKKIVLAGKGMECLSDEAGENTQVIGFVPSLAELMGGAAAFVSPVFSGSGAKIKIVEALMHGKRLIASEESLFGYDTKRMTVSVCRTAEDYIRAINGLDTEKTFYPENRELFLTDHELHAVRARYGFLEALK